MNLSPIRALGKKIGDRNMESVFRKSASPAAIATEVTSLSWLAAARATGGAPVAELLRHGDTWLETRHLTLGSPTRDEAREFGRRLARTHAAGAPFFGAAPPGLAIGDAVLAELPSPVVAEPSHTSWGAFFAALRLAPHMDRAQDAGCFDVDQADRLWSLIDRVAVGEFDAEQPRAVRDAHENAGSSGGHVAARIHGDLWGGNIVWSREKSGTVGTLIDPSAHGGHAETDLAELTVFGSPHVEEIIAGYDDVSALADGWRQRVPIHQLHMLLVHVEKFGEGYVQRAVGVTDGFR